MPGSLDYLTLEFAYLWDPIPYVFFHLLSTLKMWGCYIPRSWPKLAHHESSSMTDYPKWYKQIQLNRKDPDILKMQLN